MLLEIRRNGTHVAGNPSEWHPCGWKSVGMNSLLPEIRRNGVYVPGLHQKNCSSQKHCILFPSAGAEAKPLTIFDGKRCVFCWTQLRLVHSHEVLQCVNVLQHLARGSYEDFARRFAQPMGKRKAAASTTPGAKAKQNKTGAQQLGKPEPGTATTDKLAYVKEISSWILICFMVFPHLGTHRSCLNT